MRNWKLPYPYAKYLKGVQELMLTKATTGLGFSSLVILLLYIQGGVACRDSPTGCAFR